MERDVEKMIEERMERKKGEKGVNIYFTGGQRFPLHKVLSLEISEGQSLFTGVSLSEIPEEEKCLGMIFIFAPTLEQALAQIEGGERQLKLKYKRYLGTEETE